jgi:hypothetical protein
MDSQYTIITIITVLMFLVPLLLTLNHLKSRMNFSLTNIRLLFNLGLIYQIGVGLIFYLTFLVFGGDIFRQELRTEWFDVVSMATVWFYIIGLFYYIPALILLNLLIGVIKWIRKNKASTQHGI